MLIKVPLFLLILSIALSFLCPGTMTWCQFDWLTIEFVDYRTKNTKYTSHCGSEIPEPIKIHGRMGPVTVMFQSDTSISGKGFELNIVKPKGWKTFHD